MFSGILSSGILSFGDFVLGDFVIRGFCLSGILSRGFCPRGFCTVTNQRFMGTVKQQPPSVSSFSPLTTLNTHFPSVTNRHPPLVSDDLPEILDSPIPPNLNGNLFAFTPVTDTQVLKLLNFTYSNSCSLDHITKSMLKLCAPSIISHLTSLINASFSSSIFPSSWKNSHIRAYLVT